MDKIRHLTDYSNLPLSDNQQRLWIITQQNNSDPSYNLQLTYHLEGEINTDVFKRSIALLFERQHTVFSVFRQKDGVPYLSIVPRPVIVTDIDFTNNPKELAGSKIELFISEQSRTPFDLVNGPLYRLNLIKESDQSYFLSFTIHHLIFDGFSRRIFIQDLSRIYNNLINGGTDESEPPKFHSYDFAAQEKKTVSAERELKHVEYWREYLRECPTEIKFPYDFQRKRTPDGLGRKEFLHISKESSDVIRKLSQEADTSVFNVLLSILGILFNKFTGSNDVCIGVPVSNRRSYPSFQIFGFFVDTLPVRLRLEGDKTFREYLGYSSDVFNRTIQNALPFDKIVKSVNPERIPGLNPFFQVAFSWTNNFTIPLELGGVKGTRVTVPECVSSFDISFSMWENNDVIEGEIEYRTELIKHETIERLLYCFLSLVNNLVEHPDIQLGPLSMLTETEKEQITAFNNTSSDYPADKTVTAIFEEQVKLFPDKAAVVYKDKRLTYSELNKKSNQLARTLRNSGIKINDHVGLLVDKSTDMIVALIGILKAGGAYVPLDPEYPEQRKNFIIHDSGCKIIITEKKYSSGVRETEKLNLDSDETFNNDGSDVDKINKPSDLAYIIYTSGTTGIPKGTLISHNGVVRLVCKTNFYNFTPEDRVLQMASIVFDASVEEIFGALLNGSTLYIIDKETILNPEALGEIISKNNITTALIVSALFTQLADTHCEIFERLKTLMLGGDVLSAPHINKLRKLNPGLTVLNVYGPTENACISTAFTIDKDFEANIPIGKPVNNTKAYVFDKNMNYLPVGIIGELYVGGDGLSAGYLNREDLNKTSFIENPQVPGERIYKTGDLARWLHDGNLEFHGRIDNQVKIRGFRIELEEIESVLSEIDGIVEAVVKPVKIDALDVRLVAFLDVPADFTLDQGKLIESLRKKLPHYMIPSLFKMINGFPLTINGKIDRHALTTDLSEFREAEAKMESRELTYTEQRILKIWQDAIRTKSIGLDENFFDAGGNSLLSIMVVDRIEKEFKIKLDLRVFFDSPVIRNLAEYVDTIKDFRATPTQKVNSAKKGKEDKTVSGEI